MPQFFRLYCVLARQSLRAEYVRRLGVSDHPFFVVSLNLDSDRMGNVKNKNLVLGSISDNAPSQRLRLIRLR